LALVLGFRRNRLFFFYIFFEMSLIPILLIILSRGRQPERLSAGAYLLFYTTAISVPYLAVVVSIEIKGMITIKSSSLVFRGIAFFLLAPFFIKIPMFGFHF
jgi:NADH-ubiquinone oxidoreductase chain 4